jgi:hypothetical protein
MNETLRKLLDAVPERPPRSKLAPHAEVIRELRKKRRTYYEIAAFLREHLHVTAAPSTIHEFVKTRARQARNRAAGVVELPEPEPPKSQLPAPTAASLAVSKEAAREQIRAAKERPVSGRKEPPRFEFDPQQPLILNPKAKEK